MPTREEKYKTFQALHERPGIFLIPNPFNPGTAKILTALGFEALATTSAGYAFNAGRTDSNTAITREGVLANATEIVEATDLPVSADLQDGFGRSPESCAETIRLAAQTGLAGGSIEDATGDESDPIYEFKLAVERVAAAAKVAVVPATLVLLAGGWVMAGGGSTVSRALELVAEPKRLVTRSE